MLDPEEVRTPRLPPSRMQPADRVLLRQLDTHPGVAATMGGTRSAAETKAYVAGQVRRRAEHGFGWCFVRDVVRKELPHVLYERSRTDGGRG